MQLQLSKKQAIELEDSLSDIDFVAQKAKYISKTLWQRIAGTYPCATLRATDEFYQDSETATGIMIDFISQLQSMITELRQRIDSETKQ